MRVEDFGFIPVTGDIYTISFIQDGELLVDVIYDGSPLPEIEFKDNSKVILTVTNRDTGSVDYAIEFIHYNGKLYKSKFDLNFKSDGTNSGADVSILELAYDLTSGSINIELQAFEGEEYTLVISDTSTGNIANEMPITHKEDMIHSIPVEMVQGNEIKVALVDQFGQELDYKNFTAPISTDWRETTSVTLTPEDGSLQAGTSVDGMDDSYQGELGELVEVTEEQGFVSKTIDGVKDNILPVGICVLLIVVLFVLLVFRKSKGRKRQEEEEFVVEDEDENLEDFR